MALLILHEADLASARMVTNLKNPAHANVKGEKSNSASDPKKIGGRSKCLQARLGLRGKRVTHVCEGLDVGLWGVTRG
jgi:hypothetical protein